MRDSIARALAGQTIFPPLDHHQLTGPYGYFGPLFDPDPPPSDPGGAAEYRRRLESMQGDAGRLATQLFDENLRLQRQVTDLTGQKPAAGSVILTPEQAAQWQIFTTLGKAEEVKSAIAERDTLKTEHEKLRRETTISAAASAANYNTSVLTKLSELGGGKEFEVRDATVNGQVVKVAYIKDGDVFKPLKEYAQTAWPEFMPSLQVPQSNQQAQGQQQQNNQQRNGGQGNQQQGSQQQGGQGGQQFIEQHAGGSPPPNSLTKTLREEFQARRNNAPNPLAPQEK